MISRAGRWPAYVGERCLLTLGGMMAKNIVLVGTLDTKGPEYAFIKEIIESRGHTATVIDVGVIDPPGFRPDISREEVARAAGTSLDALLAQGHRNQAMAAMSEGAARLVAKLYEDGRVDGILGMGGSNNATVGTAAMRALPVGVPKLMVTTMASGNIGPYVGVKDVTMMYSVVDIAGINGLSARILTNAACGICGMAEGSPLPARVAVEKPLLGASMFGITTPCVTRARGILEEGGYEVLVFHANGGGGQALESLIEAGYVRGVMDVTLHELADEMIGGIFKAGPTRMEAAGQRGIPQVIVPGALDVIDFGPIDTVPEQFRQRKLYPHNPTVTHMRSTTEEMARFGAAVAEKANKARGPVAILLPLKGISAIDKEGGPMYDPEADAALFEGIRAGLSPEIALIELDMHINDDPFAETVARTLLQFLREETMAS